jgi:DNA-binding transcriptional ArsR family regulator
MISEISRDKLDQTDACIIQILRQHRNGCRISLFAPATGKTEGAIRYRLLTLEACGIVKAVRERGSTTYFLQTTADEKTLDEIEAEPRKRPLRKDNGGPLEQ